MRLESLSKNIVDIIYQLSLNDGLAKLLFNNVDTPFLDGLPSINKRELINPKSDSCKIFPYPFDPTAQLDDASFLRIYYPNGSFNENEVISETQINIDIVVAKNLWLINDGQKSMIRPYEIMSRVTDILGQRSLNNIIKLKFTGWNHLAVNTKFDAIRLYSEYYTVEAG